MASPVGYRIGWQDMHQGRRTDKPLRMHERMGLVNPPTASAHSSTNSPTSWGFPTYIPPTMVQHAPLRQGLGLSLDSGPYNNDGRTPAYGAFERNAMGWIEPTVVDKAASITLNDIRTSNEAVLIPTSKNTEFFLLENRQQKGGDIYLPGHGMLVWHVDYDSYKWMSNAVNNTASHQYVDIEEAGGNANNESATTMASYTFRVQKE